MSLDYPKHWSESVLDDCLEALIDYRGKSPGKTTSGVPLVTAKIVKNGRIAVPDEYIAEEDYDEWMRRGIPEAGDVVLTTEAPLGEVAQLDGSKVALAQRIITLRGKPDVLDNSYLKYFLLSDEGQSQLHSRSTGTTVSGIRQSELRRIRVLLPPIVEQRAIAHILGTLDNKIELNRRQNETLEAVARALFKSWFVDFDPVRAKSEGRDTGLPDHIADLFPSTLTNSSLGDIPFGWSVQAFASTVDILGGGTPKTSVEGFWNGDIPWFSVVDAPKGSDVWVVNTEKKITQAGVDNSSTQILPIGTTIISARGTVGRLAMVGVPMAMNQSCYGLRGKASRTGAHPYFSTRELITNLQQHAHGSIFDTITRATLEGVTVAVPPQQLILAFEEHTESILEKIRLNIHESISLGNIRDMLIPKLLSGEIRATGT